LTAQHADFEACNKTTALTALTAVYRVIDGLMGTG
jgi:hypothetical protein